jgi:hypothetical protein
VALWDRWVLAQTRQEACDRLETAVIRPSGTRENKQTNINFNLYNDIFDEKTEFEGQIGVIGILKKKILKKKDFSCFLVLKTGKLSNFTFNKFFVPLVSAHFHYIFMKLQVESLFCILIQLLVRLCRKILR